VRRPGRVMRRTLDTGLSTITRLPVGIDHHEAPPPSGMSLWHDVDLFVKSWLDEEVGLFRYVNEMPKGGLQKFEVQPRLPENIIEEDLKGSTWLTAFGQPVPFNYGCLPQTFRDPERLDPTYGAPGDDDPLDVLDLGFETVGVGEIVECRPLGAVCLIDEGKADWKILAVNTSSGRLANAKTIEDVERLCPGRIQECLQWFDNFKQFGGKSKTKLHAEVHGPERAIELIKQDHASWKSLLDEVGADGRALGHWVRSPQHVSAKVFNLAWGGAAHGGGDCLPSTPPSLLGLSPTPVFASSSSSSMTSPSWGLRTQARGSWNADPPRSKDDDHSLGSTGSLGVF